MRLAVAALLAATRTLVMFARPAMRPPQAPATQAQGGTAVAYEVEVLPGVGATGMATDLTETTG